MIKTRFGTFMLEFHVHYISPLHSNDLQILCSIYIGLHKLRTPYAFPVYINLSLMKYSRQKIIILDAEISNLPTRKLQQVNAYMMEQEITLKKIFSCISIVKYIFRYMFFTLASCGISSGYALFVKVKKDLRAKI